jgi:hypothetical protein
LGESVVLGSPVVSIASSASLASPVVLSAPPVLSSSSAAAVVASSSVIVGSAPSLSVAPSLSSALPVVDSSSIPPDVVSSPLSPVVVNAPPVVVSAPSVAVPSSVAAPTRVSARHAAKPPGFWGGAALQAICSPPMGLVAGVSSLKTTAVADGWVTPPRKLTCPPRSIPRVTFSRFVAHSDGTVAECTGVLPVAVPRVVNKKFRGHHHDRPKRKFTHKPVFPRVDTWTVLPPVLQPPVALQSASSALHSAAVFAAVSSHDDLAWFDTRRPDEFDLDGVVAHYAGVSLSVMPPTCSSYAYVASGTLGQLRPVPSTKGKEVSLARALPTQSLEKLIRCCKHEIEKQQRVGCLGTRMYTPLEVTLLVRTEGAQSVRAHVLFKDKNDGRETCRIAGMGDQLPIDPTACNFSAVSSDDHKMFALSFMQAHCQKRKEKMNMSDFDIVGGFLRVKRQSKIRMVLLLPTNLPHPAAGM